MDGTERKKSRRAVQIARPMPDDCESMLPDLLPLFVYGTLRTGGGAEWRMRGARQLGETTIRGVLYDLGSYPALVHGPEGEVHGELWICPPETLARLDMYEGVGEGLFDRVRLESADGPCWAYVAGERLRERLAYASIVPSGRWREAGGSPR